jgi:uncharacterized phage-associated protein
MVICCCDSQMYEARKICNLILAQYDAQVFNLTNLRLNKLLYFIHGWALTTRPQGLVRNHFEAWKLGPVIKPVFDTFKVYENNHIERMAEHLDYASGKNVVVPFNDIASTDVDFIFRIFENYTKYTTGQLVALSHEPGGPWDLVFTTWSHNNRLSPRIPNDLIRQYFLREAGGKKSVGIAVH